MPRIIGVRCGVNTSFTGAAAPSRASPCAISGWWRWPGTPYALKLSRRLGEQRVHFRLAAGARDARLRVGDQMVEIDDAALEERQEAELHRRRIAAGVGDDARLADRARGSLPAGRTPPRRTSSGHACFILYHCSHSATSLRRKSAAMSMMRTPASTSARASFIATPFGVAKNTTSHARQRVARRLGEFERRRGRAGSGTCRRRGMPGFLARGDDRELAVRMLREQAQQLDAGVAGAADDADLDRFLRHRSDPSA